MIYKLAQKTDVKEAEAVVISCTNWQAVDAIEDIERDLRKPVVTANQTAFWHALRLAGIQESINGFGKLLRDY